MEQMDLKKPGVHMGVWNKQAKNEDKRLLRSGCHLEATIIQVDAKPDMRIYAVGSHDLVNVVFVHIYTLFAFKVDALLKHGSNLIGRLTGSPSVAVVLKHFIKTSWRW